VNNYWNGEKSLANTFWLLWVFGSIITPFLIGIITIIISAVVYFPSMQLGLTTFIFMLLFNPYYIFCWVSVWRSASQSKSIILNVSAKILVVLHICAVLYTLAMIPELAKKYF